MDPHHRTLLPSLAEALENVKNQRAAGTTGLFETDGQGVPEFADPHEVSHTHPFTPERDEELGPPLKTPLAKPKRKNRRRSRKAR
jgi:hypothetical protein